MLEVRRRARSWQGAWGGTSGVKRDVGEWWRSVVVIDEVGGFQLTVEQSVGGVRTCVGSRWIK